MKEAILQSGTFLKEGVYQIQDFIYRGSSCVLYFAEEQKLSKSVVIKEFYPQHFVKRGWDQKRVLLEESVKESKREIYYRLRQAFWEECKITESLRGELGFAPFFDCFEENDTIYLILEFIQGKSYFDFVRICQSKHSIQPIRNCLCQICEKVEWLHKKQIVHRDIKPSNILVTEAGLPILLDFGNAVKLTKTAKPICSISRRYAPPEFYQNKVGGKYSDLYALGVLIAQSLPEEEIGFFLRCLIGQAWNPNPYLRLRQVKWFQKAILWNL